MQTQVINLTKELLSALRSVVSCWENVILEFVQSRMIFIELVSLLDKDDDLGNLIMIYSWQSTCLTWNGELSDLLNVLLYLSADPEHPLNTWQVSFLFCQVWRTRFTLGFCEPCRCWQKFYTFLKGTAHSNGYNVWWWYIQVSNRLLVMLLLREVCILHTGIYGLFSNVDFFYQELHWPIYSDTLPCLSVSQIWQFPSTCIEDV